MKIIRLCLIALFLFSFTTLRSQVYINEYSCSNFNHDPDNYNLHEDWIELYNPTSSPVNIGGYYLSDKLSQPFKWKFPPITVINANSYLVVWASGRDEVVGNSYHTNFRLSQTKWPTEEIVFSDVNGTMIDHRPVEVTQSNQSRGRKPDAGVDWKICLTPTPGASNSTSTGLVRYSLRPLFNIIPGFFTSPQTVTITTQEPNATIHYTLDGTEPTAISPTYTTPIVIDSTTVLKAVTFSSNPNFPPSFMCFGTYFINDFPTLPVVSVAANQLDELADGDGFLTPHGSIEYFDINHVLKTTGYGEFNRHGQDSWANDQRSLDFVMRDEFGYNYALQEPLFGTLTNRSEFQRVILRAAGDDNYPAAHHVANHGSAHLRDAYVQNLAKTGGLDVDVRVATKSIVYINGKYWGVYDLREIPDDHDFTDYYYGQGKYKIQYIETWGATWAEYGGQQSINDWNTFYNYVMTHDMTQTSEWNYVNSQLDVKSLVDYVIVNSVTVCSDWLNFNTGWWRGLDTTGQHRKWGYILWDNDAVFGFYENYTGVPDKGPLALPCNVETGLDDPEGHIDLLNKLRQNQGFNNYYLSRYIDLNNTVFSCENMLRTLDSISAVIDPEMTRHAQRWFGTYNEWHNNLQTLRDYIDQRCNAFSGLMNTCYTMTGPFPLYVTTDPIGAGNVQVNTIVQTNLPTIGNYHGNIPVQLYAMPDSLNGFQFDHWSIAHHAVMPSNNLPIGELHLTAGDTLIAHFSFHSVGIPERTNDDFAANVYPSVFSNEARVDYYQPTNGKVSVTLHNSIGTNIWSMTPENSLAGIHNFILSLGNKGIAPGIYLLNFKSEKINKTLRIVYTGN